MSPQRRWYLLHREEIRLKRSKHYYENRDSILADMAARRERARAKKLAIKTEQEIKDADKIHGESSPVLLGEPGGGSGSGACLLCGHHGGAPN